MTRRTTAQTPRERLESFRSACSRAFRRSIDRHDVTQSEIAAMTGTAPQKVQVWADHHRPEVPTLAHLPLMPREVVIDLVNAAVESHGLHVSDHSGDVTGDPLDVSCLCETMQQSARLNAELIAMASGCAKSHAEKIAIRDAALEQRAAMSSLITRLQAEITGDETLFSRTRGEA